MSLNMRTELVLLSFLEYGSCSDRELFEELTSLSEQLKPGHPMDHNDLLSDGNLQTDGNHYSMPAYRADFPDQESEDENICRRIGHQLAQIGDELDCRIQHEVINNLIQNLLDDQLTSQEKDQRLCSVIDSLMASVPAGLEQEKAKLTIAMLLAKKVSASVPGLLQRVFWTTVGFINQHLCSYINNLTSQANI